MREVRAMIDAVAPTDATVLILGESGSGKEMVAQAIHQHSARASREMVTVDSCGLQENLFESELFGHERGAFTGADRQKKGLIEEAVNGTLFLDEIGDVGPAIQAKLLRVMETRHLPSPGRNQDAVDRTRASSSPPIATSTRMSEEGSFRSDLYFRLSRFVITVPPLRDRRDDIEPLARHFVAEFSRIAPIAIGAEAMALLHDHPWPGNVRELRNAIERAVIVARPGQEIRPEHLGFIPRGTSGGVTLRFAGEPDLEEIERTYLAQTLARHGGNRQKAAGVLGISERNIYRLIEKFGIR